MRFRSACYVPCAKPIVFKLACGWEFFLGIVCCLNLVTAATSAEGLRFDVDIQPILAAKCAKCHGESKQQAGLRLDTAAHLLRGGESGPAITPFKADDSLLFQLVRNGEMPPKNSEPLSVSELARIEKWLTDGAVISTELKAQKIVTTEQIVPLMLLRCAPCHGGRRQESNLDVRTKSGMLRGGKSGPAVIAGQPEDSLLVKRIHAGDMPPRRQLVSVSIKPMEASELELLKSWIASGMPEASSAERSARMQPSQVTEEDRQFWAFRSLAPPATVSFHSSEKSVGGTGSCRNRIDQFIHDKLQVKGLDFSPEADKATLFRRVHFDVVGLPPDPDDMQEFVADRDPRAYEKWVERLLASPRYGERWGRHWLDAAGYADSEGAQNEDRIRSNMWRYRDYVIRAFNSDKPYDQFLHEQLAGDELVDYQRADDITNEIYDSLVATGFLRTAPDRTFANITNFVPDRLEVIADEIQILGSSVLGLTMHCARCHAHKFDPISQVDYYRLAALLKDALDEHDWLGPEQRSLKQVTKAERDTWLQHDAQITSELAPLKEQLKSVSDAEEKKKLEASIKDLEAKRKPEPSIRALWSRGDPSPTFLLTRGNYLTPGVEVEPGVPTVLASGSASFVIEPPRHDAKATGRRLALARWLTQPEHPLTARVFVNRLWKHHFGIGIVSTLSNFGKTGSPPTHPELLDWLAYELVRQDWSQKEIHRLILTSTTYRQSSLTSQDRLESDPDNRWLSRMPLRRLEAEVFRDSLLYVAGRLDLSAFGPPDGVEVRDDGLVLSQGFADGGRRSVYVLHRRTKLPTLLENFDSPQMGPNCIQRGESTVAPQALHLLNNAAVHSLAKHFADSVLRAGEIEDKRLVVRAHENAFGSAPTEAEIEVALESFAAFVSAWRAALPNADKREVRARALQNYCHALFNSAGFLYVD